MPAQCPARFASNNTKKCAEVVPGDEPDQDAGYKGPAGGPKVSRVLAKA
jgi:hypothetical protein